MAHVFVDDLLASSANIKRALAVRETPQVKSARGDTIKLRRRDARALLKHMSNLTTNVRALTPITLQAAKQLSAGQAQGLRRPFLVGTLQFTQRSL